MPKFSQYYQRPMNIKSSFKPAVLHCFNTSIVPDVNFENGSLDCKFIIEILLIFKAFFFFSVDLLSIFPFGLIHTNIASRLTAVHFGVSDWTAQS